MTTDVLVRADDITGPALDRFGTWMEDRHPDVPCAAYAMHTDTDWEIDHWRRAHDLIVEHGWELGGTPVRTRS